MKNTPMTTAAIRDGITKNKTIIAVLSKKWLKTPEDKRRLAQAEATLAELESR